MIILRAFKVVYDRGENPILLNQKIITKWKTDYDFGFDITKPSEWKKYLANYTLPDTGKKLPHQSKYGDLIIYDAYMWGVPKWVKDAFDEKILNHKLISLFPGYDSEGNKLDIKVHGMIR